MKRPTHNRSKPSTQPTATGPSTLRIIGGQWRGRKLAFPSAEGLRPTGDRIRETLFNWLMFEIQGARCLDAFSGSGALGFEALSRGASHTTFLDSYRPAVVQINENLALLESTSGQVTQADTLTWLKRTPDAPFDVVFIDPPFLLDLWQEALELLETQGWLSQEAWVYIESPKNKGVTTPSNWQLKKQKSTGGVHFSLYQRQRPIDSAGS